MGWSYEATATLDWKGRRRGEEGNSNKEMIVKQTQISPRGKKELHIVNSAST